MAAAVVNFVAIGSVVEAVHEALNPVLPLPVAVASVVVGEIPVGVAVVVEDEEVAVGVRVIGNCVMAHPLTNSKTSNLHRETIPTRRILLKIRLLKEPGCQSQ